VINWAKLAAVVLSWVISPIFSLIIAFVMFKVIVKIILGQKESFTNALKLSPIFIGLAAFVVVLSFLFESLLIALAGGVLGCIAVLPLNGFTAGTINWQTFSHLAFAFKITPDLLVAGVVFAVLMGLLGGVLPAIRAARLQVAHALREL